MASILGKQITDIFGFASTNRQDIPRVGNAMAKELWRTGNTGNIDEPIKFPRTFGESTVMLCGSCGMDEALIFQLYKKEGTGFAHRLKGSFAVAIWDSEAQSLVLATDRFGTRPVYFLDRNGEFAFSTSVKALMACPNFEASINLRALATFFSIGFLLGNETLFQSVQLMPPATTMVWRKGKVILKRYWEPVFDDGPPRKSLEDYGDRLIDLLGQAVSRQINGNRTACQLSGGLDSRTIAALATGEHPGMPLLTWGVKECDDLKFARQVSKILRAEHYFFELSADFLSDLAPTAVYLSDGLVNYKHAHFIGLMETWRERYDAVLGGDGGGNSIMWVSRTGADRPVADLLFKDFNYYIPEADYQSAFSPRMYDAASTVKENFAGLLREAPSNSPENIHQYFNVFQHDRRFCFPLTQLQRQWQEKLLPFYDYDLVDFCLSLPPELKADARLHSWAFKRRFPKLAAVPWQKHRWPVAASGWKKLAYRTKNKLVREADKRSRQFFGIPLIEEYWEYRYADWFRTDSRLRSYVTDKILGFAHLEDYFKRPYVEELINRHMSGTADHQEQLGILLTFVLWHEMFVERQEASIAAVRG